MEEKLEEFRAAFALFDKDGNGKITLKELREVMKELGQNPTEKAIQEMMKAADQNGNGVIEFSEFIVMMNKQMEKPDKEKEYTVAFGAFDKDNSGYISKEELKKGLKTLGVELSDQEIEDYFKECDDDGDDQISYEEFVQLMLKSE